MRSVLFECVKPPTAGDLRNTVLHMLEQLGGKLLRLIRDDLEFHGLLEALDHRIADVAGQEAVDQAENDRLDLEIIDEVGQGRDDGVDGKHDPDDVHLRRTWWTSAASRSVPPVLESRRMTMP